jgi:hypothetical protein
MPNDEIKEKINLIKNIGKTFESIRVNSTNLLPEIWDRDNSIKKKWNKHEAKDLITKCEMMNLKKKSILINNLKKGQT